MPKRKTQTAPVLTPYQGWCWRGAKLAIPELAAYLPGERTLHLGVARARLGCEQDFPVLFRVYAHHAWVEPGDPEEVVFPSDSVFVVREFQALADNRTCFFLEQVAEDSGAEDLMVDFRVWLPKVIGNLAKADPDLERAWAEPFARWDLEAEEGDAPRLGVVYEAEDAVTFTMAYTGRDEATVRSVLDAHQRYLELAFIAQGPQDEDLLREREIMRHLLPEEGRLLDYDQEMAYLKLVTGLEAEVIDEIQNGELKYCESIGIVERREDDWGSEGLGRILADHGGHWAAVAAERSQLMAELVVECPDAKHLRVCVPSPDPSWATVSSSAVPQAGALETVRIDGVTDGWSDLITAFPAARDGAPHLLRIHRVLPAALGCEALVEAATATGAGLCFFDIDHLHPWNEREEGEETTVALAAFASTLGAAPGQDSRNSANRKIRETRRMGFEVDPGLLDFLEQPVAPPHLSPCGLAEYDFIGEVATLDELWAWGQAIYRLDLSLLLEGEPFSLPVYVADRAIADGYRPWPGDAVQGRLWLQGGLPGGKGRTAIISTGDALD